MSSITNPTRIALLKKAFDGLSDAEKWEHILKVIPTASLETDNDGQYVVYTDIIDPQFDGEDE